MLTSRGADKMPRPGRCAEQPCRKTMQSMGAWPASRQPQGSRAQQGNKGTLLTWDKAREGWAPRWIWWDWRGSKWILGRNRGLRKLACCGFPTPSRVGSVRAMWSDCRMLVLRAINNRVGKECPGFFCIFFPFTLFFFLSFFNNNVSLSWDIKHLSSSGTSLSYH